jgi:hypothetical protein
MPKAPISTLTFHVSIFIGQIVKRRLTVVVLYYYNYFKLMIKYTRSVLCKTVYYLIIVAQQTVHNDMLHWSCLFCTAKIGYTDLTWVLHCLMIDSRTYKYLTTLEESEGSRFFFLKHWSEVSFYCNGLIIGEDKLILDLHLKETHTWSSERKINLREEPYRNKVCCFLSQPPGCYSLGKWEA